MVKESNEIFTITYHANDMKKNLQVNKDQIFTGDQLDRDKVWRAVFDNEPDCPAILNPKVMDSNNLVVR